MCYLPVALLRFSTILLWVLFGCKILLFANSFCFEFSVQLSLTTWTFALFWAFNIQWIWQKRIWPKIRISNLFKSSFYVFSGAVHSTCSFSVSKCNSIIFTHFFVCCLEFLDRISSIRCVFSYCVISKRFKSEMCILIWSRSKIQPENKIVNLISLIRNRYEASASCAMCTNKALQSSFRHKTIFYFHVTLLKQIFVNR